MHADEAQTRKRDDDLPDERLMARMAQNDVPAFDALFGRHRQAVFGFARRMTGEETAAEDIAQETFLRLWRARHVYRPAAGATLRTYLLTITRRLVLDHARRRPPWACPAEAPSEQSSECANPPNVLAARELAERLEAALTALPAELREVALLRDAQGMRYDEIARITGCPLGTVKSRLNAARLRLRATVRAYLDEEDV